ncbi:PIN domain-containing protein, partial [Mesorhizobium sp.]|uniref:PIN domain-containing protein n=1 Tax=Mesorhizobium sp. TaxID=1871066 RepID=UPI0012026C30
ALAAAEVCRKHKLATADAIIFATARAHDATLLTCDKRFESLPVVTLIEKI